MTDRQFKLLSGKGYFNPINHYKVAKENIEKEIQYGKATKIADKLEDLNKRYNKGEIEFNEYSQRYDYLAKDKDFQAAVNFEEQMDLSIRIATSNMSEKRKLAMAYSLGLTDFLTFISAPVRVVRGLDIAASGGRQMKYAETQSDKVKAGLNVALGAALAGSGFAKFGGAGGLKSRIGKYIPNWAGKMGMYGVAGGFGVGYGLPIYQKTGSVSTAVGAGAGVASSFFLPGMLAGNMKSFSKGRQSLWKNKRGRFEALERHHKSKLDPFKRQIGKEILSKVEKDLLSKKTAKEQIKILKDLKKKWNTPEGKKNFDELIKLLNERGMLDKIAKAIREGNIKGVTVRYDGGVVSYNTKIGGIIIKVDEKGKILDVSKEGLRQEIDTETKTRQLLDSRQVLEEIQKLNSKLKQPLDLMQRQKLKIRLRELLLRRFQLKRFGLPGMLPLKFKGDERMAYQPIVIDKNNKPIPGHHYLSMKQAAAKGQEVADNTRANKFYIQRVMLDERLLKENRGQLRNNKFKVQNGMIIEKRPYRKDVKGEKGMSVMKYIGIGK